MKKRPLKNRASVTLALGVEMARNSVNLTKTALAARADCSRQHVADIEQMRSNPSQLLVAQLADALGRTPAELYQLGELKLEQQTLEIVRERRLRVRSGRDLKAILEALQELDADHLSVVADTSRQLSEG